MVFEEYLLIGYQPYKVRRIQRRIIVSELLEVIKDNLKISMT